MKTSLNGHEFIEKTNPRIELRGRLDELNARIILAQVNSDDEEFRADLEEVRQVILNLSRCEVRDEKCNMSALWGISENEIHERSHNPQEFYGRGHIVPCFKMGKNAAEINLLRTLVREVELCACRAFGETRADFTHVLNRLSSALYILTFKYLPEN